MALDVGGGWELAETTLVGHHAALIDLLPNLVAALVARGLLAAIRAVVLAPRRRPIETG